MGRGFVMLVSLDLRNTISHHITEVDDCGLLAKQGGGK